MTPRNELLAATRFVLIVLLESLVDDVDLRRKAQSLLVAIEGRINAPISVKTRAERRREKNTIAELRKV